MLHNITWGQFFTCSALVMIIYYAVIAIRYYRNELVSKIKGGGKIQHGGQSKPDQRSQQTTPGDTDNAEMPQPVEDVQKDPIYDHASALMDDIDGLLYAANQEGWDKDQVVSLLSKKIKICNYLKNTQLYQTVNRYVIRQASEVCDIEISEAEMSAMWK